MYSCHLFLISPHRTHFSVDDTVAAMQRLRPRHGYVTHMGHDVEYHALCRYLPDFMRPAYDGLEITLRGGVNNVSEHGTSVP